jgi:hypothetical protein
VLLDDTTPVAVAAAVLGLLDEPGVLAATAEAARLHARGFSLERWRDLIGARLEAAWGRSLKDGGSD